MSKKDQAVQAEPKNRTSFEFVALEVSVSGSLMETGIRGKNYADTIAALKRAGTNGLYRIARLGPTITVKVQTVNKVVLS